MNKTLGIFAIIVIAGLVLILAQQARVIHRQYDGIIHHVS